MTMATRAKRLNEYKVMRDYFDDHKSYIRAPSGLNDFPANAKELIKHHDRYIIEGSNPRVQLLLGLKRTGKVYAQLTFGSPIHYFSGMRSRIKDVSSCITHSKTRKWDIESLNKWIDETRFTEGLDQL